MAEPDAYREYDYRKRHRMSHERYSDVPIDDVERGAAPLAFTFGDAPEAHGLAVRVADVTPEQAAAWLGNNWHHRDTKPKTVKKYAARMDAGEWFLNGKTIVLDRDGKLMGGQHRLLACVKSGKPFRTVVVWGVDPAAIVQDTE